MVDGKDAVVNVFGHLGDRPLRDGEREGGEAVRLFVHHTCRNDILEDCSCEEIAAIAKPTAHECQPSVGGDGFRYGSSTACTLRAWASGPIAVSLARPSPATCDFSFSLIVALDVAVHACDRAAQNHAV